MNLRTRILIALWYLLIASLFITMTPLRHVPPGEGWEFAIILAIAALFILGGGRR